MSFPRSFRCRLAARLLLLLAGILSLAATALAATVTLGIPVWSYETVKPNAPFQVHRFYVHPYNYGIYVADLVYGADGTPYLVIENLKGYWCGSGGAKTKGCLIPVNTPRGAFVEVTGTVEP